MQKIDPNAIMSAAMSKSQNGDGINEKLLGIDKEQDRMDEEL